MRSIEESMRKGFEEDEEGLVSTMMSENRKNLRSASFLSGVTRERVSSQM